jgi:catechol 2,3-dioxygenase-like lactoylglutathione lyase family enzyme
MIVACHTLIYSDDAAATRAFFRDVLQFPNVDDGDGWLIFHTGPSEMGVHPTASEWEGDTHTSPRKHMVSFMCDDIDATKADLESRGATFSTAILDHGYGRLAMIQVPGADDIQIYEPAHDVAYTL